MARLGLGGKVTFVGMTMKMRPIFFRKRLIALAMVGLLLGCFAYAFPGAVACSLVDYAALDKLSDGTRFQSSSTLAERAAFSALLRQASARIADKFGAPRAHPVVVYLKDPHSTLPFISNSYGSTSFIGSRACVVLGPDGFNIDVIAHEMMHAELFERVGFWAKLTQVPVWFDEGLAMQLDTRAHFAVQASDRAADFKRVRELTSASQFFVSNGSQLTQHYAFAKAEVGLWVEMVGKDNVYVRLARLKAGDSFERVIEP